MSNVHRLFGYNGYSEMLLFTDTSRYSMVQHFWMRSLLDGFGKYALKLSYSKQLSFSLCHKTKTFTLLKFFICIVC